MDRKVFSFKTLDLPKMINLGGQNYEVILCNTDAEFLLQAGVDDAFGVTLKLKKKIIINLAEHKRQGASPIQILEMFYHEVGHGLFEESGLSASVPVELEEIIVDLYSKYIVAMKLDIRR